MLMEHIQYMIHYFNLEQYATKENVMATFQLLYYWTVIDGGSASGYSYHHH